MTYKREHRTTVRLTTEERSDARKLMRYHGFDSVAEVMRAGLERLARERETDLATRDLLPECDVPVFCPAMINASDTHCVPNVSCNDCADNGNCAGYAVAMQAVASIVAPASCCGDRRAVMSTGAPMERVDSFDTLCDYPQYCASSERCTLYAKWLSQDGAWRAWAEEERVAAAEARERANSCAPTTARAEELRRAMLLGAVM